MVYQKICLSIDNRNSFINMKGIYWKGIKQRIGRFLDKVYDCILIFTDWLGKAREVMITVCWCVGKWSRMPIICSIHYPHP